MQWGVTIRAWVLRKPVVEALVAKHVQVVPRMVAALPLAAKVAPAPAPPTAQVQPRGVVAAVTTARAAKLIVAIPPHPQDAAAALPGAPPFVRVVAQPLVKGVSTPVKGIAKLHVMEVANNSARVRSDITCKRHD